VAPVDVLQAALGVVVGADSEVLLVLVVPGLGYVLNREVAADQVAFDLEPDDGGGDR